MLAKAEPQACEVLREGWPIPVRFDCDDLDARFRELRAQDGEFPGEPQPVPGEPELKSTRGKPTRPHGKRCRS